MEEKSCAKEKRFDDLVIKEYAALSFSEKVTSYLALCCKCSYLYWRQLAGFLILQQATELCLGSVNVANKFTVACLKHYIVRYRPLFSLRMSLFFTRS